MSRPGEVGEKMSSDKLSAAARAAGFAMACDETAGAPVAKPASTGQALVPVVMGETQMRSLAQAVNKLARPQLNWAGGGWSFWKTA